MNWHGRAPHQWQDSELHSIESYTHGYSAVLCFIYCFVTEAPLQMMRLPTPVKKYKKCEQNHGIDEPEEDTSTEKELRRATINRVVYLNKMLQKRKFSRSSVKKIARDSSLHLTKAKQLPMNVPQAATFDPIITSNTQDVIGETESPVNGMGVV